MGQDVCCLGGGESLKIAHSGLVEGRNSTALGLELQLRLRKAQISQPWGYILNVCSLDQANLFQV